jgi:hypothetical protein
MRGIELERRFGFSAAEQREVRVGRHDRLPVRRARSCEWVASYLRFAPTQRCSRSVPALTMSRRIGPDATVSRLPVRSRQCDFGHSLTSV